MFGLPLLISGQTLTRVITSWEYPILFQADQTGFFERFLTHEVETFSSPAPKKPKIVSSAEKLFEIQKSLCLLTNLQRGHSINEKYYATEAVSKGYQDQNSCENKRKKYCFINTDLHRTSPWFYWLLCMTVALNW